MPALPLSIQEPWGIGELLELATGLADELAKLHDAGHVHRAIDLAHVLFDRATGEVALAPGSDGRGDPRDDLHALGGVVHDLLTGSHARRPLPDRVPPVLASIVLRLLAPDPDARYQTAAGLAHDLHRAKRAWDASAGIEPFALATRDTPRQLRLAQRHYGRVEALHTLREAQLRTAHNGGLELVAISGHPGIGKSALVRALVREAVVPAARFATGKYEQYKREVPFATLASALTMLAQQAQGDDVGARLRAALGVHGRIATDLVPELAKLVGDTQPLPEVSPSEAKLRTHHALERVIAAFATAARPLVLFLDDLQWADAATLDFLRQLLAGRRVAHVLLIGAYRDTEVGSEHAVARLLAEVRGPNVHELALGPLASEHFAQLLSDALHLPRGDVQSLAELVFAKSGGNPLFATQLVTALADAELLSFDAAANAWRWDAARLRAHGVTDDISALMLDRLRRLPSALRDGLAVLACMGSSASAARVAAVLGVAEGELDRLFAPAIVAGLLAPIEAGYAFVHDRMQEAAYALTPADARPAVHLRIARILDARFTTDGDAIYELASQYNQALALVDDREERRRVIELDLAAARRAKDTGAHATAIAYAHIARDLLGDDGWRDAPELAFAAAFIAAESAYAVGQLDDAERRLVELAARLTRTDWLAEIARTRAEIAFAGARPDRAIALCVAYLKSIGIDWPAKPSADELAAEYARFVAAIPTGGIAALSALPAMTDPRTIAIMDVLLACLSSAGVLPDRSMHDFTILRMVNLSLEHGNGRGSPIAYARAAMTLPLRYDDWPRAAELGHLALALVERPGYEYQRARVLTVVASQVLPWVDSAARGLEILTRAHQLALESGDIAFSVISAIACASARIFAGDPLAEIARQIEVGREVIERSRFEMMVSAVTSHAILVARLRGAALPYFPVEHLGDPRHALNTGHYWMNEVANALHLGDLARAAAAIPKAQAVVPTMATYALRGDFEFHAALVHARRGDREAMRPHAAHVHRWARTGPAFAMRARLVAAEEARLDGRLDDVERNYEDAIERAHDDGNLAIEVLALELAADFYAATSRPIVSADLRARRAECAKRWGATALLGAATGEASPRPVAPATLDEIDVATVIEIAHAVASEIVSDRLVARLMTLALEHAGASRAVLLFPREDGLAIAAEATASGGTSVRTSFTPLAGDALPASVLRYVSRTHESVIIDDVAAKGAYADDPYLAPRPIRSLLALPLVTGARLAGILYLENELTSHVFTEARLGVLRLFVSHAAIALENARLFGELRRAEQHRLEAQRLSNTGSFAWNLATGEMRWSEQVYAIYELPLGTSVAPAHLLARVHPDDVARAEAALRDAAGELRLELRLVLDEHGGALSDSGRVKHIQIVAQRERDQLAGAVIDVTERRRAEQRLRDAQHRFAVTVASIADGVIATDAAGAITYMNPVAERLAPTAALGATFDARALAPDVELDRAPLADEGSVIVLRDTTARRRAGEALALDAANRSLHEALHGSNVGVWEFDYRDPELKPPPVHAINFWESFGWPTPPETLEGRATRYRPERFHLEERARLYDQIQAHLRGELDEVDCAFRVRAPDGSWRWCRYRARLAGGRLAGTSTNITEQRTLEDEIRTATAAAEAANRSKDEFLANVSHEIRTPMNAILGMTELALDTQLTAEQRHWLTTVKSAADNLLVIIDELLDFSKAAANKLELAVADVALHPLIEDALRRMTAAAQRKGLALIMDIADDVPHHVRGDAARLRQILANLVGNAIKFTNEGEIEVIVRRVYGDANEAVLTIAVRDTGIGIAEDKHAAIFEPFMQADDSTTRRFGGTGLGLSIAMRLAKLMHGRIEVESKRGKGSTFTLTARFGLADAQASPLPTLPANARVLIVDANEAERTLFAKWLRAGGLRVATAAGGVAAIDVLWDGIVSRDPIAAVLVDRALSGSGGELLVTRIRERPALAACRVIEMPGQLDKPFGKRALFDAIALALGTPTAPTIAAPTTRALRILVAEDSELNADLIRELLRRRGHDAVIVDNGLAVLDLLAREPFDLLLLDLHMPGLDGFQVIEQLRARERAAADHRHLPVVALTARSRPEDRAACIAAGMDDFLGKPIRSAALWETINRLVPTSAS